MSMLRIATVAFCVLLVGSALTSSSIAQSHPNVLFIAVDDLNDWVGVFGGNPQTQTPNIDRFARAGAVVFQNAHCAGPVCGPSRSALLSGFMPHRSGVYGNSQNMLNAPLIKQYATLPEYFAKHGYATLSRGKIFHAHATAGGRDQGQWAFESWTGGTGGSGVDRGRLTSRDKNLIDGKPGRKSRFTQGSGSEFSWGPTQGGLADTRDYKTAEWAAKQLSVAHDQPFFLAVGLSKPHLPFYAPQQFFDLYPIDQVKVPPILESDLDDILTPGGKRKFGPSNDYLWLQENELLEEVTQAYMAVVSYADACVGRILDGLQRGPNADNTIVVLWGDHGWHLGEKLRYRKATGWSESTRMPLVVRTPEMTGRHDCQRLVNLIDLYPTLVDYCGLPPKPTIDGNSFVPLLNDPQQDWREATVTIFGYGNTSVRGQRWRYIRHRDGTEELYDLVKDPQEWTNHIQAMTPEATAARVRLAKYVPTVFAEQIENSDPQLKKRAGTKIDDSLKSSRDLDKLK